MGGFTYHEIVIDGPECHLLCLGDPHYGHEGQVRSSIKKAVKHVMDTPNTYLVAMGDNIEAATKNKHGVIGKTPSLQQAVADFAEDFRELAAAGKLAAVIKGNHCERVAMETGTDFDPIQSLLNEWEKTYSVRIPYGDPAALLKLKVKRDNGASYDSFLCCFIHGSGNGTSGGAIVNGLLKMQNLCGDADFYCHGHKHSPHEHIGGLMQFNNASKRPELKEQLFVCVGANMIDEGYSVRMMLQRKPIKNALVTFTGRSHSHDKKRMRKQWFEDL